MRTRHTPGDNPLIGFQVDPSEIGRIGNDLKRPECILAERDGTLWAADARGGVMRIGRDGSQQLIVQTPDSRFDLSGANAARSLLSGTLPNGLAFASNGDILISNFGTNRLEQMSRSGETKVLLDRIDGKQLGKVNFVLRDRKDRIWITISTMVNPWSDAISSSLADGSVILIDPKGPRIVADGFRFANEIRFDANEEWLYIAETTGKNMNRLPGTAVYPHLGEHTVPLALRLCVERNHALHEQVIIVSAQTADVPHVPWRRYGRCRRYDRRGGQRVVAAATFGFQDRSDIPEALHRANVGVLENNVDPDSAFYYLSRITLRRTHQPGMSSCRKRLFIVLAHHATSPADYLYLPDERTIVMRSQLDF